MQKIVTFDEYNEVVNVPSTISDITSYKLAIEKDLAYATSMLDDFCGGIFVRYNAIKDSIEDKDIYDISKLKEAIIELTRYRNLSNGLWIDLSNNVGSYTSAVSEVDKLRRDIFEKLKAGNWYKGIITNYQTDEQEANEQFAQLQTYFDSFYLKTNGNNTMKANLQLAGNTINNSGDIYADAKYGNKKLYNFDLEGKAKETDRILDRKTELYKFIDEFDIHYFDGLSAQEIFAAIAASDKVISKNIPYAKGWIGIGQKEADLFAWYESLIDNNLNNLPVTDHPEAWQEMKINPIDMKLIYEYIDGKLAELKKMDVVVEAKDQILEFENETDFENYKKAYNLTNDNFADVEDLTEQRLDSAEQKLNNLENKVNNLPKPSFELKEKVLGYYKFSELFYTGGKQDDFGTIRYDAYWSINQWKFSNLHNITKIIIIKRSVLEAPPEYVKDLPNFKPTFPMDKTMQTLYINGPEIPKATNMEIPDMTRQLMFLPELNYHNYFAFYKKTYYSTNHWYNFALVKVFPGSGNFAPVNRIITQQDIDEIDALNYVFIVFGYDLNDLKQMTPEQTQVKNGGK